jgi:hypothetical protein
MLFAMSAIGSSALGRRIGMKEKVMKKIHSEEVDDMRPEYDFSGGVRGKYAAQYAAGTNVVRLEPDVAAVFPDSESVNAALRMVMRAGARAATSKIKVKRAS